MNEVARNTQRKYLKSGETKGENLLKHREVTSKILQFCVVQSACEIYGLNRGGALKLFLCIERQTARYHMMVGTQGEERARLWLFELVKDVEKEPFLLPALWMTEKKWDQKRLWARRDAAEIMARICTVALIEQGYGSAHIDFALKRAKENYEMFCFPYHGVLIQEWEKIMANTDIIKEIYGDGYKKGQGDRAVLPRDRGDEKTTGGGEARA